MTDCAAATNPSYTANLPGTMIEDISSTDRAAQVGQAAEQLARDADVLINQVVLPDAKPNQTVSEDDAVEAKGGKRWAECLCLVLSLLVQRNHCEHSLDNSVTPTIVYVNAAVCFAFIIFLPLWVWLVPWPDLLGFVSLFVSYRAIAYWHEPS